MIPQQTAEKVPQGSPREVSLLASLRKLLAERPAVGERSLLVWARQQRPPLTSVAAERLASTLVARREASVEMRPDGSQVWRGPKRPPPSAAKPKEEPAPEPSPTPPPASVARATPTPEEEPVMVAGTPAECRRALESARRPSAELLAAHEEALAARREMSSLRLALAAALGLGEEATWKEMCQECKRLRQEADDLRRQVVARTAERDELLRERDDLRRRLEASPADAPTVPSRWLRLPAAQRETLAQALADLSGALRGQAVPNGQPLSPMMRVVLGVLPTSETEAITPTQVAERAGVEKMSVYAALRRLGERGLATTVAYGLWRRVA